MAADAPPPRYPRAYAHSPAFNYLEARDRYLSAPLAPSYRFAIIGCGMMGIEHLQNTMLEGRATVGGLYDPAPSSLAAAEAALARFDRSAPRIYRDLADAASDDSVDALLICTPNYTHRAVFETLLDSGKALFLEKPIATTVEDAWALCQLAANHSAPVRFGLQYRYKAIYAEAIQAVFSAQAIGQVRGVNMLEHRFPFLDKVGQWNKFNAKTGGTLVEKCCHYFDLLNLFAQGRPQRVFATGHQAVNYREFAYDGAPADGLDQASVIVDYDNQVVGTFELCMFAPGAHEQLIVTGDRGRLRAEESALLGERNRNTLELWGGEHGPSRRSEPRYPRYIEEAGHHGSTFMEHVAFVDELGGATPLTGPGGAPTLADGFWSVVVGAAAQRSIAERRPVEVAELLPDDFDPTRIVPAIANAANGAHTS
ncbi:MAG: Gfo/Idh/MocA family oxidoreductase [Pseudomonadota bacterium]